MLHSGSLPLFRFELLERFIGNGISEVEKERIQSMLTRQNYESQLRAYRITNWYQKQLAQV